MIVYEDTIYHLKGISDQLVPTIGATSINLQLEDVTLSTEFQVVHPSFPIPHDGILGKPFLSENQTILNYKTNEMILATEHSEHSNIPAHSESVISIPVPNFPEGETLLIEAQVIDDILYHQIDDQ